jgi:hypothetical protein
LNQPQVIPFSFSRSPMLRPDILMRVVVSGEQTSSCGRGLPMTVPAMVSGLRVSDSPS